jgi:hypothetical protein
MTRTASLSVSQIPSVFITGSQTTTGTQSPTTTSTPVQTTTGTQSPTTTSTPVQTTTGTPSQPTTGTASQITTWTPSQTTTGTPVQTTTGTPVQTATGTASQPTTGTQSPTTTSTPQLGIGGLVNSPPQATASPTESITSIATVGTVAILLIIAFSIAGYFIYRRRVHKLKKKTGENGSKIMSARGNEQHAVVEKEMTEVKTVTPIAVSNPLHTPPPPLYLPVPPPPPPIESALGSRIAFVPEAVREMERRASIREFMPAQIRNRSVSTPGTGPSSGLQSSSVRALGLRHPGTNASARAIPVSPLAERYMAAVSEHGVSPFPPV